MKEKKQKPMIDIYFYRADTAELIDYRINPENKMREVYDAFRDIKNKNNRKNRASTFQD